MAKASEDKGTLSPWHFGVLALLCVLAFWPMFRNGFVWDDGKLIVENSVIRGLWPPARFFDPHGMSGGGPIIRNIQRPVMAFSLASDYAFWKLNPFGYHLTNLILHLLCVFGVTFLVQRLSRSASAGFLAGALFALLPGHAEGVIAFEGRSDLLATLFVLLGLWGYVAHLSAAKWRRALRYLGSFTAYLAACFSKETGLVLLGILVIYEGFVLGRSAGAWTRRALRFVPFLLIALLYLGYRGRVLGGQTVGSQWWGGSPGKNFLMTFEVYAFYLRLLFFPLKLNPSPRIPVPGGFWDVPVLWGLALLLASLLGIMVGLRRNPRAGFLASWFALGLLPVANFIPIPGGMVAERWLYLPSMGACGLGGWGAWVLYRRTRGWTRTVWAGLIVIPFVLFGARTWLWNATWRSWESMVRTMVVQDPGYGQWHYYLGSARMQQGKFAEAEQELREALRLSPALSDAHNNLGIVLGQQGRLEEAVSEFREALRQSPDVAEVHNNLGTALVSQGNSGEAVAEYREALRLKPGYAEAHNNLGFALEAQGNPAGAVAEYREALRLYPDYAETHYNLGKALRKTGNTEAAIAEYREALRLNPDHAEAHFDLGCALEDQGRTGVAVSEYREAIRLKPDYLEALENLAMRLDSLDSRKEARGFWLRADKLEKRPKWIERIKNRLALPD